MLCYLLYFETRTLCNKIFLLLYMQTHFFEVKIFKLLMVRDMSICFVSKSISPDEVL